jgi:hypothetical protein
MLRSVFQSMAGTMEGSIAPLWRNAVEGPLKTVCWLADLWWPRSSQAKASPVPSPGTLSVYRRWRAGSTPHPADRGSTHTHFMAKRAWLLCFWRDSGSSTGRATVALLLSQQAGPESGRKLAWSSSAEAQGKRTPHTKHQSAAREASRINF